MFLSNEDFAKPMKSMPAQSDSYEDRFLSDRLISKELSFSMNYELWLSVLVVVSFGIIHFIEVASFLARVAGVENGDRALAYALQNAVFMATRFFSMLLLPVLGLLIDLQIEREHYLLIVVSALLSAFYLACALFCFADDWFLILNGVSAR